MELIRTPQTSDSQKELAARSKSMVLGELTGVSRSLDRESALRSGWLKRQRSIMKNWQLRWFVLRTEALYFYKDQHETKAQGCIPLQGSQVSELHANQDESSRHLFEIVTGGSGERDQTGISHESYLLMANSQSDMEEWVRAIHRAIWAPLGGVFGQNLEETVLCGGKCDPRQLVPVIVEQCVCFIREYGLKEEGLFRAPGQTNHVRELQHMFDCGEKPVFDSTTDVHTVASLLKLYIRELPEPIVPFDKYPQFLSCAHLLTKDKEMGITELGKQVNTLPLVNYNLLKYICKFLDEIQSHSNENKMSAQNLATVFGPNILRPRVEDPVTMMEEPDIETSALTQLQQRPTQRGRVEWISKEDTDLQPSPGRHSKSYKEELKSSTSCKDIKASAPGPIRTAEKGENDQIDDKGKSKTERKVEEKTEEKTGRHVMLSPSKQTKAMPSWRSSFKGRAASGGAGAKMGESAGDMSAASGNNWLINGLSSFRAYRRTTSSGEKQKERVSLKDLALSLRETTLSHEDCQKSSGGHSSGTNTSLSLKALHQPHRLSSYDNFAPSSLSLPADTSSLWTAFEISLAESEGHSGALRLEQGEEIPKEPKDNTNVFTSQGKNEHLSKHVTELEQEMKKQRMTYETCLRKLEQSCSKYQHQVMHLEEELDHEKKNFKMLELRLRNSERAYQEAEKRNTLLQKELEEFFKTLGDLTTGTSLPK
ncbi:rho GTPase-activating protein 22 isoform X2 [Genypterus blacodes]|uniref:rho GTPase-activating protein 22 isoform X2 n=1 Tax=Genypterus blacodes TaxID=154954 RepID=UPI003F7613B4